MTREPFGPGRAVADHYCSTVGATVYCDALECPYCDAGDDVDNVEATE